MQNYKSGQPASNHSNFPEKENLPELVTVMEQICINVNAGGWILIPGNGNIFLTNSTKHLLDLPLNYDPTLIETLQFFEKGDERRQILKTVRKALSEGIGFDEEFGLLTASGRKITARITANPEIKNGNCIKLSGIVQNLSQLHEAITDANLYEAIARISGQLIQAEPESIDNEIYQALKFLGMSVKADYALVVEIDDQSSQGCNIREWFKAGIEDDFTGIGEISSCQLSQIKEILLSGEYFVFDNGKYLPTLTDARTIFPGKSFLQYFIAVPMVHRGSFTGFLGFMSRKPLENPDKKTMQLLKIVAGAIAGALNRMAYEKSLIHACKQAEAENQAKSEFLVSMGHDIKSRLHELLWFSQHLLDTTKEEKSKQPLQQVSLSANSLLKLFDDLVDFSNIELSSKKPLVQTRINNMAEEIKQMFLPEIEKKKLDFYVVVPDNLPIFKLDLLRLKYVLVNLAGYAVKFTHRGNITMTVKAARTNSESRIYDLEFSIKDTGIGMTNAVKNEMIEFINHSGSFLTKKTEEMGLGLYIVKKTIRTMGARLTLNSVFGRGTEYILKLSGIEAEEAQQAGSLNKADPKTTFKGQTILMVEDIKSHFLMVESVFENSNLRFIHAKNGQEGIKMAEKLMPDLILMDIKMEPCMDGFQATRLLKENQKTCNIPVIAFTTNLMDAGFDENKGLFDDVLAKVPMRQHLLEEKLKRFLDHVFEAKQSPLCEQTNPPHQPEENSYLSEIVKAESSRVDKLCEITDMAAIEKLVTDLENYLKHRNSPRLEKYINALKNACEEFDFEELNNLLREFTKTLTP
jgi:signal transduction histidine kinase